MVGGRWDCVDQWLCVPHACCMVGGGLWRRLAIFLVFMPGVRGWVVDWCVVAPRVFGVSSWLHSPLVRVCLRLRGRLLLLWQGLLWHGCRGHVWRRWLLPACLWVVWLLWDRRCGWYCVGGACCHVVPQSGGGDVAWACCPVPGRQLVGGVAAAVAPVVVLPGLWLLRRRCLAGSV